MSKLFEKTIEIQIQITEYLIRNKIPAPTQFGFRKKYSTIIYLNETIQPKNDLDKTVTAALIESL